MVLDKKLLKRMKDIEALPADEKEKVYYFLDMAITYNKIKKAYSLFFSNGSIKSSESFATK